MAWFRVRANLPALSSTWHHVLNDIRVGKCTERVKSFIVDGA